MTVPVRRTSQRITRGKARAQPDVEMDVDKPVRGRKRAAEHAISDDDNSEDEEEEEDKDEEEEEEEEEEDDIGGDPTPRKAKAPPRRPEVSIVVDSPPRTRPKQRIRVNEAGDAVASSPASEEATVGSQGVWVGRSDVSVLIYYYMSA